MQRRGRPKTCLKLPIQGAGQFLHSSPNPPSPLRPSPNQPHQLWKTFSDTHTQCSCDLYLLSSYGPGHLCLSHQPQTPCLCMLFLWVRITTDHIWLSVTLGIKFSLSQALPSSTAPLSLLYLYCLSAPEGVWVLNLWKRSLKGLNLAHTHSSPRTLIRSIYKILQLTTYLMMRNSKLSQ